MNTAHEMMDDCADCADWAHEHPITRRLTEAELNMAIGRSACHGPCNQGRLPCKTPMACQTPDDEDQSDSADAEVLGILWRFFGLPIVAVGGWFLLNAIASVAP